MLIYQVTQMGKTKLCFSWGLEHPSIIIQNLDTVTKSLTLILDEIQMKILAPNTTSK